MNSHELTNESNEQFITISDVLKGKSAEKQLDILAKADRIFFDRTGRYYGGRISDEEAILLDPKFKKNE